MEVDGFYLLKVKSYQKLLADMRDKNRGIRRKSPSYT